MSWWGTIRNQDRSTINRTLSKHAGCNECVREALLHMVCEAEVTNWARTSLENIHCSCLHVGTDVGAFQRWDWDTWTAGLRWRPVRGSLNWCWKGLHRYNWNGWNRLRVVLEVFQRQHWSVCGPANSKLNKRMAWSKRGYYREYALHYWGSQLISRFLHVR